MSDQPRPGPDLAGTVRSLDRELRHLREQVDYARRVTKARALAALALVLTALPWLAHSGDRDGADALWSGTGLLHGPWRPDQATGQTIVRIALAVYLLVGLALLAIPLGRVLHPVLSVLGGLATLVVLISSPTNRGGTDYSWWVAPVFALLVWAVLTAVGLRTTPDPDASGS